VYNYKFTLKEIRQLEVLFGVAFELSIRACLSRSYTMNLTTSSELSVRELKRLELPNYCIVLSKYFI
jgi:hypothetical protein